jgi:hypothetical protein
MKENLIAPCGMNCSLCYAYQREKNKCLGCNDKTGSLPSSCQRCIIRNCSIIKDNKSGFCYECEKYPCQRLKQLDKRYRTKYNMSMVENLEYIKSNGMNLFLGNEKNRWTCNNCCTIICIHHNECPKCKTRYLDK